MQENPLLTVEPLVIDGEKVGTRGIAGRMTEATPPQ